MYGLYTILVIESDRILIFFVSMGNMVWWGKKILCGTSSHLVVHTHAGQPSSVGLLESLAWCWICLLWASLGFLFGSIGKLVFWAVKFGSISMSSLHFKFYPSSLLLSIWVCPKSPKRRHVKNHRFHGVISHIQNATLEKMDRKCGVWPD